MRKDDHHDHWQSHASTYVFGTRNPWSTCLALTAILNPAIVLNIFVVVVTEALHWLMIPVIVVRSGLYMPGRTVELTIASMGSIPWWVGWLVGGLRCSQLDRRNGPVEGHRYIHVYIVRGIDICQRSSELAILSRLDWNYPRPSYKSTATENGSHFPFPRTILWVCQSLSYSSVLIIILAQPKEIQRFPSTQLLMLHSSSNSQCQSNQPNEICI